MKKILFFMLLLNFVTIAQWQADARLTNNSSISYAAFNNAYGVAASSDTVHVVWTNEIPSNNFDIYYKRSTDGGATWGAEVRLTNTSVDSRFPAVSISGPNVYVVWREVVGGTNAEIFFKRSTNGGMSWEADVRLTNDPAEALYPAIAASGALVHVVWTDERDGNLEIYCKRSTDGGLNWGADTRFTIDSVTTLGAAIAVSGQYVHVVWYGYRNGNPEMYYRRSTDGGVSWENDLRLTNNLAQSRYPSISCSGQYIHVVWNDTRSGNWKVFYKRSTDGGVTWGEDTQISGHPNFSEFPSVSASGEIVHVVWFDMRDGNWEVYYMHSFDRGVNWGAEMRLSNAPDNSWYPTISASGNIVHVVWCDYRDANWEMYYKRDPTGNFVEIKNTNSEIPGEFSLEQNYPNPFNPNTIIRFKIKDPGFTTLKVFDILGREVETLLNEQLNAGTYEVDFDGSKYTSGVYYYKLITGVFVETRKMVLIK